MEELLQHFSLKTALILNYWWCTGLPGLEVPRSSGSQVAITRAAAAAAAQNKHRMWSTGKRKHFATEMKHQLKSHARSAGNPGTGRRHPPALTPPCLFREAGLCHGPKIYCFSSDAAIVNPCSGPPSHSHSPAAPQ